MPLSALATEQEGNVKDASRGVCIRSKPELHSWNNPCLKNKTNEKNNHKTPSKQGNPHRVYTLGELLLETNEKQGHWHNFSAL